MSRFRYPCFMAVFMLFLGAWNPATVYAQCGVTIPNGERCEAPGGANCEFYTCVNNSCVPSGDLYLPGTKCGCFADECFDDFCDSNGNCVCGFFAASAVEKCASEQSVCDGIDHCDGVQALGCLGTTDPAPPCGDGIACTEDCNPVDACVTYEFNNRCDDGNSCTDDFCISANGGCESTCNGTPACAGDPTCQSLPVEMVSFQAYSLDQDIVLEWMTAIEIENKGFGIELSSDGTNFQEVAFVSGAGTVNEAQFYTHSLKAPGTGIFYLRLQQVDLDGAFSYSRVEQVNVKAGLPFKLNAPYPNPFVESTHIPFSVGEDGGVSLRLYNYEGKLVQTLYDGVARADRNYEIVLKAGNLRSGVYFYELATPKGTETHKLILVRN